MAGLLEAFRDHGRLSKPLLALCGLVLALLLLNAFLHDPTTGYDAQDHLHYVESLAAHWRLPLKSETGQYYSPPLAYLLPAVLTSLQLGLWKALKLAQFFNVLLAAGTFVYLVRICELVSPQNLRLKLLSLGLLSLLPVFYRSFALVRGEPGLAFLGVFVAYETLVVFLKGQRSVGHILALGMGLGLSILARQWGLFFFPAVVIFALWTSMREKGAAWHALGTVAVTLLVSLLVGGWFYILIFRQYGTLTAFDRAPQELSPASAGALLSLDASSAKVFSDPVRPSLQGRLFPILYADTWGDYWGYFLVYARNVKTGDFEDGIFFQKLTIPAQVPPNISTDRFEINRYLGALNMLDLIPTAILVCGLIYGLIVLVRFLGSRAKNDADRAIALLAMMGGASMLGFLWFILRYQSPAQAGDLIKATYLLQALPTMAFLAASLVDRLWDRRPGIWRAVAVILCFVFLVEIPAFITHYVPLSVSPGSLGFALSTILFIGGLGLTWWIHTRYPLDVVVEPVAPPKNGPLISVCIPARNEADHIRTCLEAMLAQTYPNFEVIVVDDRSTDATPQILQEFAGDPRLHIVHGSELPEGWAGKPHALVQAAAAAHGQWLCLVDADTRLVPEALAGCYASAVATGADLFTMLTRQITGTFWEKTVMPLIMTALSVGFPPRAVNDPRRRTAVANGQFIMIKRDVYDTLGGHERIKDKIVEDKALAELVKWSGYRLILADGRHVASTRMYTSLPQMWEGWTKNIFLGLSGQPAHIFLGAFGGVLLVLAALVLPVWPLLGLLWYLDGGGWLALAVIAKALIVWAVVIYARAAVAHGMGISRWYALTTPLGSAIFAAMMLTSAWKVISGRGVTWRGRRYRPSSGLR